MKKLLPNFRFFVPFIVIAVLFIGALSFSSPAYAVDEEVNPQPTGAYWVVDPEVTFIGKNAARAGNMLDWTLQNYNWVCVTETQAPTENQARVCDNSDNPLAQFWSLIVISIVVPLLFFVILATALVIIITRGRSLTIMRFIPRFVAVILLIVFSYSILQFFYQFTDLIQGFFLKSDDQSDLSCPPNCISQADLLYVGWDYRNFVGLRLLGDYNAESAFISLLLTKLTALTYFVMVGILLMRKIILWFFIIVSPIFPLLLLYYPTRNTGKIWIGEFFRWLLYAPLFAIFLKGLVSMWRWQSDNAGAAGQGGGGVPLIFNNPGINQADQIIYPTAVNILLGGPQQLVTPTNSVNLTETFALYVVALIMLWVVILLPWILLQIFLDYAANFAPGDSAVMKTLVNLATANRTPITPGGQPPAPTPPGDAGIAMSIPFAKKFNIPKGLQPAGEAKEIVYETTPATMSASQPRVMPISQANAQILNVANLSLPSMRDIAKYETALLSKDASQRQEVTQVREKLERIANPMAVTATTDRQQYNQLRDRLRKETQQGNNMAASILNAASTMSQSMATNSQIKNVLQQIANPASVNNIVDRERMTKLNQMLSKESKENNNALASSILSVNENTSAKEVEKIRDTLMQAKQQEVAVSVMNTISGGQKQQVSTAQMQTVLQQIANPASITNVADREKMTKLHDTLSKESKENNNQLATSILSVTDKTSTVEIEKIQNQIMQAKENSVASSVLSTIDSSVKQVQSTEQVRSVLQQIANPAVAVSPVEKERLTKLKDSLSKASKEGNELAGSILGMTEKTSTADIEKLQEKILQAKEKGEPIATELAKVGETAARVSLPSVNRVQNVSQQDYKAIKDMWKENYQNLEVPEGMAGNRSEWIRDDIAKIDEIVGMLTAADPDVVNQGMQEVSDILPFLLVGGFSQTEVVGYLKAKQDAAKEISVALVQDEEEKVTVTTRKAENQATMAATMDEPSASNSASVASGTEEGDESLLASGISKTTVVTPTISNDIMNIVDLKIPKMRDIARYETRLLSRDKTQQEGVAKAKEILTHIANPMQLTASPEREKYEALRERLVLAGQKGDITAGAILSAAQNLSGEVEMLALTLAELKNVLVQIADPTKVPVEAERDFYTRLHEFLVKESESKNELATQVLAVSDQTSVADIETLKGKLASEKQQGSPIATQVVNVLDQVVTLKELRKVLDHINHPEKLSSDADKAYFTKLHDELTKASTDGNATATQVLVVKETAPAQDIQKLFDQLQEAKKNNDPIAAKVLGSMGSALLTSVNTTQQVNNEEYTEVKKMWEENYQKLLVPQGYTEDDKGRMDWIKADMQQMTDTVNLLVSPEKEKKEEGMKKVTDILPFLLLGGFSFNEIIAYLQTKREAAETVLKAMTNEEEQKISVPAQQGTKEQKEMKSEE
ncbi:MAG: hypothetical protein AAB553_02085 [Patescibacteria group bacterium]